MERCIKNKATANWVYRKITLVPDPTSVRDVDVDIVLNPIHHTIRIPRLQCQDGHCIFHEVDCKTAKDVFGTRHSQYDVKEPNWGRLFRLFHSEVSTLAIS